MCGIFGFWLNRPLGGEDIVRGRSGTRRLSHRGPDGEGIWSDAGRGLFLGHRRLAIIDLDERSAQPMRRNNLAITFNGEIYNYQELRGELACTGERFTTTGDTEVLLAAWSRWGEGALDRIDGMFAFALDDGDSLILATDPFGEKPLYVARTAEGMWFASEPQALIAELGLTWQPDPEDMRLFLALGFLPPPRTGFPGLETLPPGTIRRYARPDAYSERRYWQLPPTVARGGPIPTISEHDIDHVAKALVRSLRYRLRADVPLGLFLSSGIDSALVAALCVRELNTDLTAFTVAFPDGVDEAPAAAAIAAHLQLPHRVIDSRDGKTPPQAPAALVDLYGVPNDNLSGLAVARMSELARGHVTVALSGAGGDELAFGYNKYAFLWNRRRFFRLPSAAFAPAAILDPVLRFFPAWRRAREYLAGDRTFRYLAVKNGGLAHLLRDLADGLPSLAVAGGEPVFSARDLDVALTLPESYLAAIDRGSMRVGLEVRTPYLSREVFAAVAAIDPRALVAQGLKSLLRRLLLRYLPTSLVDDRKRGFVSPLSRYVATLDRPPQPPGISQAAVADLWQRRSHPACAGLLLRLGILARLAGTS